MPYERRDYDGAAVATTIVGALTSGDTTISIAASTSWPDGSPGPFYAVIDRATASEEVVKVTTRTGTTLSSVTRGVDGTSAVAHAAGAAIEHCMVGVDLDEANYAVNQTVSKITTAEDLLVGSAANALKRLGVGSNGQLLQVASGVVGWGALPAGVISSATMFGTGVVDAAAIASNAVDTAELAANAVTTAKIAANAVDETKIASSVAGSGLAGGAGTALSVGVDGTTIEITADQLNVKALGVGTSHLAANAVTTAKITDANVTAAKVSAEAWTSYNPTVGGTGWAAGNGTLTGAWIQYGKVVHFRAQFTIGSTTTVGSGGLTLTLPTNAIAATALVCSGVFSDNSGGFFWEAKGVPSAAGAVLIVVTDASDTFPTVGGRLGPLNSTHPVNLPSGISTSDYVLIAGTYEAA